MRGAERRVIKSISELHPFRIMRRSGKKQFGLLVAIIPLTLFAIILVWNAQSSASEAASSRYSANEFIPAHSIDPSKIDRPGVGRNSKAQQGSQTPTSAPQLEGCITCHG